MKNLRYICAQPAIDYYTWQVEVMINNFKKHGINPTNIDILFSKEENKYRFNQFWDITDDRGEYNPIAQRPIWDTAPNGYVRVLNPNNLNYNKAPLQRKKFRHYTTSVLLRKRVVAGQSMNYKMLVMIADTKNLYSPR